MGIWGTEVVVGGRYIVTKTRSALWWVVAYSDAGAFPIHAALIRVVTREAFIRIATTANSRFGRLCKPLVSDPKASAGRISTVSRCHTCVARQDSHRISRRNRAVVASSACQPV